jgi:hypothetical protein
MTIPGSFLATLLAAGVFAAPAAGAPAQPGRGAPAPTAPDVTTARGVIRAVSPTQLVLVGTGGAAETVVALDAHTVVERLGKSLGVADLKVGDPVTVTYAMRSGKALASRVWVRYARDGGATPAAGPPARPRP